MRSRDRASRRDASPPTPGTRLSRTERRVRSRRKRNLRIALIALVVGVLGAGSALAYAGLRLNSNINRVDVSKQLGVRPSAMDGPLNILLAGSDTRVGEGNDGFGDGSWEPGDHSDTNLLVHISADRSWATVVSIPRDSMTPAPPDCSASIPVEQWVVKQWNKNYTDGGAGCLIRTLEGDTGIYVNHYGVVDFAGFKDMVDALGGVPVCLNQPINDPKSGLDLAAGEHVLDGEQSLGYVRARYTVGDGSDLSRIKRQQAFLSSVVQQATSTSLLARPDKLYSFLNAATKSLTTDPEFTVGAMSDIAGSLRNIGIKEIVFVTVPTEPYPADKNRVQWTSEAEQLWQAVREDRPITDVQASASPSGSASPSPSATSLTVSPADIKVEVVNGSGVTGLGAQVSAALAAQGFKATKATSAVEGISGVLVEHGAGDEAAARTVAAAFPDSVVKANDSLKGGVRVTVGAGAPAVVEVPNRVGSTPLPSQPIVAPSPSPSATLDTRTAADSICS